jgi:hypothetical protein
MVKTEFAEPQEEFKMRQLHVENEIRTGKRIKLEVKLESDDDVIEIPTPKPGDLSAQLGQALFQLESQKKEISLVKSSNGENASENSATRETELGTQNRK